MLVFRHLFTPARIIFLGYLAIIFIGAFLLMLPFSHLPGKHFSFIDSLFTATSATTVTGLVVKDTQFDFSLVGKVIILILIQIGGLGYMTVAAAIAVLFKQQISLKSRLGIKEALGILSLENVRKFVFKIFIYSFIIEAIGALILFLNFLKRTTPLASLGQAVFHSVAAFCNAGFSIFSRNLEGFAGQPGVVLSVAGLFIIGGLGFPILDELFLKFFKKSGKKLSAHAKLVFLMTAILIVFGFLIILLNEHNNALNNFPFGQKILVALFSAVAPRTAGFSLVNQGLFTLTTTLVIISLMFIGASPGGTGGGIKTTTLGIIIKGIGDIIKGQKLNFFRISISDETLKKAFTVFLLAVFIVGLGVFVLSVTERPLIKEKGLRVIVFEEVSAFGTVGLSTGSLQSPNLSLVHDFSIVGKLVIIITMFLGRIGVLLLVHTIISSGITGRVLYPEKNVIIG